jgi:Ca-activated chloride channel family protein
MPAPRAEALEWADLWLRSDQRGGRAFAAEDHARAAELFADPAWRAAALYRAGNYETSAEALDELDTADAHYNRGNALARSGEFQRALEAYAHALELDPEHEDARFNRDLLLQRQPQPQSQDQQQGDPQQQQSDDASQQQDQQSASSQPSDPQSPENMQPMDPDDAEQASASQAATESERPDEGEPEEFEPLPTPGELEEWASEQAADQWLRRIPEDPGGLLRRKFLFQYQRMGTDQDGNQIWPGEEEQPW